MSDCPYSLRCIFDEYDPMTDESYCVNCGNAYKTALRRSVERDKQREELVCNSAEAIFLATDPPTGEESAQ